MFGNVTRSDRHLGVRADDPLQKELKHSTLNSEPKHTEMNRSFDSSPTTIALIKAFLPTTVAAELDHTRNSRAYVQLLFLVEKVSINTFAKLKLTTE